MAGNENRGAKVTLVERVFVSNRSKSSGKEGSIGTGGGGGALRESRLLVFGVKKEVDTAVNGA